MAVKALACADKQKAATVSVENFMFLTGCDRLPLAEDPTAAMKNEDTLDPETNIKTTTQVKAVDRETHDGNQVRVLSSVTFCAVARH